MIIIDAYYSGTNRGIGNYTDNLIKNINYKNDKIYVIARRDFCKLDSVDNVKVIKLFNIFFPLWENLVIPYFCFKLNAKILFSVANTTPFLLIGNVNRVVTIHDIIFNKYDRNNTIYQKIGRFYQKINLYFNMKKIKKVITVSQYSKMEISEYYKIQNVFCGYEGPGVDLTNSKKIYNKNKQFLHFCSDDPRKNTYNTIKAFLNSKAPDEGYTLVLIGNLSKSFCNKYSYLFTSSVIYHGYVNDEVLVDISNQSYCLLYASKYEGFGLPIIEFQRISVLVITSNSSSCAEIGKDCILVDPNSHYDISKAIDNCISVNFKYDKFVQSGLKNSLLYEWKNCSNTIIEEVINS